MEYMRAYNPILEEGLHVPALANGVQHIADEPNGTDPYTNVADATVSNYHQPTTNDINNGQFDDLPPIQHEGLEYRRAHSPISEEVANGVQHITDESNGTDSSSNLANAPVSNCNQSTTSDISNDQFDDLPPVQHEALEYMRAHTPISEGEHHVRTLADGVQHIANESNGTDPDSNLANAPVSNCNQSTTSCINNDQFEDLPPIQHEGLEYMRAHTPISEGEHHVRTLANGVQHISNEPNGTRPHSNVANALVSNYHQSTTNDLNNDQFDDLPPIQHGGLEYIRAHNPISEEGHHVRRLADGVQHTTNEPNGTHPYASIAVRGYTGRTMTGGSSVNTGANTPIAVYGRQHPMVPTQGFSNARASAQLGYSPHQQQRQPPPKRKSKGIFALLFRCG